MEILNNVQCFRKLFDCIICLFFFLTKKYKYCRLKELFLQYILRNVEKILPNIYFSMFVARVMSGNSVRSNFLEFEIPKLYTAGAWIFL